MRTHTHKSAVADRPSSTFRLFSLAVLVICVLLGFLLRIYYLTILRGEEFLQRSEKNYRIERAIPAPRGNLITADGEVMAVSRTVYNVEITPLGLSDDQLAATVRKVARLLKRPEIADLVAEVLESSPEWNPVRLTSGLTLAEITPLMERRFSLPGIDITIDYAREYLHGSAYAHVTGYLGVITEGKLADYLGRGFRRDDHVGKLGAERQFEPQLMGAHGKREIIRDARGRPMATATLEPARRGNDIRLTIRADLQSAADRLIGDSGGVVIALDPNSGGVLAMVSKPDYDANTPMRGVPDGTSSLFNKAIRGRYAPASTFKLITASAGLANGYSPTKEISCRGNFRLPNFERRFWCDVRTGHYGVNLTEAIQKSCNVFFYSWSERLDYARLTEHSSLYGFGRPTGIDLMPEGFEPRGILGRDSGQVYPGMVLQMAIGQGALIAATPLQLVNAYAAIANGGALYRPHVFAEELSPEGKLLARHSPEVLGTVPLSANRRAILLDGLRRVVQESGGTASRVGFKDAWDVAGKTGSAEVAGQELTNGWFVAFAPASAPQICIAALIEAEGHGGSTAAPIVRDMMSVWFEGESADIAP